MKRTLTLLAPAWSKKVFYCIYVTLCLLLLQGNPAHAQDPPQYGTPYAGVPDPRDVNMYQVHIRPYSAAGNPAGVTARLDAIRALGTNVIYLMPHYPNGTDSAAPSLLIASKTSAEWVQNTATLPTCAACRWRPQQGHGRHPRLGGQPNLPGPSLDHPTSRLVCTRWQRCHSTLNPFPDVAALNFAAVPCAPKRSTSRVMVRAANVDGFRCDYANNALLISGHRPSIT